jgi:hypothetical protein
VRILVGTALLATACGGAKRDPYAASLAKGSEHVEITADARVGKQHERVTGSGDFTNMPDRGQYTLTVHGVSNHQVFAGGRLYVSVGGRWLSAKLTSHSPQTPAQMFRAQLPAQIENGLVRSITIHDSLGGTATYDFSKYGEHVSVTVPRVKGSN